MKGGNPTTLLRWMVCIATLIVASLASPRASAQLSADEIYEDARDVIAELIEREAAESIAANLACLSPEGLLKYFPQTLQAIHDRNFGSLRNVVRREVVELTGNYVYQSFKEGRSIPLPEFLPARSFDLNGKLQKCSAHIRDIGGPARYRSELEKAARALRGGVYLPLDACLEGRASRVEVACAFAKATMAAASGRPETAKEAVARAVATGAVSSLPGETNGRLRDFRRALADELTLRLLNEAFPAGGIFDTFTGPAAASGPWGNVRAALGYSYASLDQIAQIQDPATRTTAMALRALVDATFPKVYVSATGSRDEPKDVPIRRGDIVLRSLPGEPRSHSVARTLLANAGIELPGAVTVSEVGGGLRVGGGVVLIHDSAKPAGFSGDGLDTLETVFDAIERKQELTALLGLPPQAPAVAREALRGLVGLVQLVSTVAVAFYDVGEKDGSFDLLRMLSAVLDGRLDDALCRDVPSPGAEVAPDGAPRMNVTACALWEQLRGLLDPRGQVRPVVAAARDGNQVALATAATSAIFSPSVVDQVCCGQDRSCHDTARLYGRFATNLVAYVLASRDDQDGTLAARAAFKSAAVDVIRDIGARGGVERKVTWKGFWRSFLVPSLSLRASWSKSYQLVPDNDRARYVATVDWPTIRFPFPGISADSPVYFGVAITGADPLAPLVELVSQDSQARYLETEWVYAMVLQPRIGGVLAVPALSKNLAVSLAASLRGAAGVRTQTVITPTGSEVHVVEYRSWLGGELDSDMFEASAAIQYIP